jgi:hypothetical protein
MRDRYREIESPPTTLSDQEIIPKMRDVLAWAEAKLYAIQTDTLEYPLVDFNLTLAVAHDCMALIDILEPFQAPTPTANNHEERLLASV